MSVTPLMTLPEFMRTVTVDVVERPEGFRLNLIIQVYKRGEEDSRADMLLPTVYPTSAIAEKAKLKLYPQLTEDVVDIIGSCLELIANGGDITFGDID